MIMSSIIVTHFVGRRFAIPASPFATRSRTLLYLPLVALRGNLLYRASHTHSHFCTYYSINHMSFFFLTGSDGLIERRPPGDPVLGFLSFF